MSWFEKAKTVLIEALDIQDIVSNIGEDDSSSTTPPSHTNITSKSSDTEKRSTPVTPTFYDNPHANEMVTIPPKASDAGVSAPIPSATSPVTLTAKLSIKRQSATDDSVDFLPLSSPTSPIADACMQNSESSLKLITATTSSGMVMSADTEPSLPDSIVIIGSNEMSDNAEGDGQYDDDQQALTLEQDIQSVHINDSIKTMKGLALSDIQATSTITGADSDSNQSFEDIQLQMSHKDTSSTASRSAHGKTEGIDQSYSSTSSDIEIISNPNGDSSTNSITTRTSPQKFKDFSAKISEHGLTLGSQLKSKGHHREPSEISLLSEDSQAELDKLVNRISELNQVIEAREQRLLQSERQNAELLERNQELRAAFEAISNTVHNIDGNEAVQRLSALEKKFQASIRERDALRIQIKSLKDELQNKIPKDELTECNEMIATLQLEGEKLSKEILQQSNIIKKLRAKEKISDTLLKKNGEQISQLSSEAERLKKSLAAKEEMERTQIEAVCKMTTEKRRVDDKNAESRSRIEDLQSKLAALQTSFDEVKSDLQKRTRLEQDQIRAEHQEYVQQLSDLREKMRNTEQTIAKREQQMCEENRELLRRLEESELRAESSTQELSITTTPLIRQIESLQKTLNQRTASWDKDEQLLLQKYEDAQVQLRTLQQLETVLDEKYELMRTRCTLLEEKLSSALMQTDSDKITLRQQKLNSELKENDYQRQLGAMRDQLKECSVKMADLKQQYQQLEAEQRNHRSFRSSELAVEAIKASSELLTHKQHMYAPRASPPLSLVNDSGSNEEGLGGLIEWQTDALDCISNSGRQQSSIIQGVHLTFLSGNTSTLEHLQSLLKQRDGELTHLQWELSRLQAERCVLDAEISNLTIELETLKEKVQTNDTMEKSFEDLQHRYDALLQMYGEKVERTEELELDLVELKQAYKIQIDELLAHPSPNLQCTPKHS